MMLRDFLADVAGLPIEPPDPPMTGYTRPCPQKECEGGVIYAGRASFDTGNATFIGGEEFKTCPRCGGMGDIPA